MDTAEDAISDRLRRHGRELRLVAIDGLGGAGKSTLARRLQLALEHATVIEVDDFYRPMFEQERRALSPEESYRLSFDWERLRDEVVIPLTRHRRARYERYDWARGAVLGPAIDVEPSGTIIVEGVYTLRPELRAYWDLSLFVETPRDLRRTRMMGRADHTPEQIDRWMAAEDYYEAAWTPATAADVVIPGGGPA